MYRREEHVAATIQRSKESRHDTFLRGREEVLAQAITSALGGGGGGGIEREPAAGSGGYAPRVSKLTCVCVSVSCFVSCHRCRCDIIVLPHQVWTHL